MRGRVNLPRLNAAIAELNELLSFKLRVLAIPIAKLTEAQLARVQAWRSIDADEAKGTKEWFFEGDLKHLNNIKPDAAGVLRFIWA
jgi:hypothetical protein